MYENFINCTYISKNYATVDIEESSDISKFIEKFDQGHTSVSLLENGKFKGVVDIHSFRDTLLGKPVRIYSNAYLEYNSNEEVNKTSAVNFFIKTGFREIPLLKNGKIVAVAVNSLTIGAIHKFNEVEFPPVYWNLIGENLGRAFFFGKKILISSNFGNLIGFKERFANIAKIETFNFSNWKKCIDGYYDLFLCGSIAILGGGVNLQSFMQDNFMLICWQQKHSII